MPEPPVISEQKTHRLLQYVARAVSALLLIILTAVLYRDAWLHEDAYITFRVIDNAVNGYGLRWNIDERVMVYTHPLWMLVNLLVYPFTATPEWTVLLVSGVCIALTVMLALYYFRRQPWLAGMFLAMLVMSQAFRDYAISGFEGPLGAVLLSGLIVGYMAICAGEMRRDRGWLLCCLLGGLLIWTRYDYALLIVPMVVHLFFFQLREVRLVRRFGLGVLGVSPFLLWLAFAFVYYGFIFPNTFYSKLPPHSDYSALDYWRNGLGYFVMLCWVSPLTFVTLAITLSAALLGLFTRNAARIPIAMIGLGVLLYCLYIIDIGGDYMAGRLFFLPYVAAVWMLALMLRAYRPGWFKLAVTGAACVLAYILAYTHYPKEYPSLIPNPDWPYIADERPFRITGCLHCPVRIDTENRDWSMRGLQQKAYVEELREFDPDARHVVVFGSVGEYGYMAGPHVTIIDFIGLTDALIARMPPVAHFRIGHFGRMVPAGYVQTRHYEDSTYLSGHLADYYTHLRRITSDPVSSAERWKSLLAYYTGELDGLYQQILEEKSYRDDIGE